LCHNFIDLNLVMEMRTKKGPQLAAASVQGFDDSFITASNIPVASRHQGVTRVPESCKIPGGVAT
jgi:hypothetical protein